MNSDQAAKFLGVHPGTLRNWRVEGRGPAYRKGPRQTDPIEYDLKDLKAYKKERNRSSKVNPAVESPRRIG